MTMRKPLALLGALSLALTGCSIGSMLGGGKTPPALARLTTAAPDPGPIARSSNAGEAVTIALPVVPKELKTTRVPAVESATQVSYIKDLVWVDTPDRLFKDLLAETVLRTTNRVVLDDKQSTLDPGLVVTGKLTAFGYDVATGQAVVRYDAMLSAAGGTRIETRRFEARAPADGTAASVGPALNAAANEVASQAAKWIGG